MLSAPGKLPASYVFTSDILVLKFILVLVFTSFIRNYFHFYIIIVFFQYNYISKKIIFASKQYRTHKTNLDSVSILISSF